MYNALSCFTTEREKNIEGETKIYTFIDRYRDKGQVTDYEIIRLNVSFNEQEKRFSP